MFFKKIDLSGARNVYAVGDIHGMFTLFETQLASLNFDPEQDHVLSVGDLVDRGPESHRAIEFAKQPWFHFVRGNHEELVEIHLHGYKDIHIHNGGQWFTELSNQERYDHCRALNNAPIIMEVLLPDTRKIGIIHADFPEDDWNDIPSNDDTEAWNRWIPHCLRDRNTVRHPKLTGIKNIDHIYYGHNPLYEKKTVANCSWIDTGACYSDGKLTIVKV